MGLYKTLSQRHRNQQLMTKNVSLKSGQKMPVCMHIRGVAILEQLEQMLHTHRMLGKFFPFFITFRKSVSNPIQFMQLLKLDKYTLERCATLFLFHNV